MTGNLKGILLALLAFGTYATHDAIIKHLGAAYSPLQILFFSVLLGFPMVALTMSASRDVGSLRPNRMGLVLLRSAIMVGGGICGFTAFTMLPMAQAYAVFFCAPLMVTLFAVPVLGERVGWHRGGAVVLGLVGVMIALNPGGAALGLGHLAAIVAATCVALMALLTRKLGDTERPIVLLLYPMFGNVLVLAAVMPWVYRPMPLGDLALLALVALLALLAARLTIAAYAAGEAGSVAPMQYSQILWAAFYGAMFFGEGFTANLLIGLVLIIGSGLYILAREMRGGHSHARPVLRTRARGHMNPLGSSEEQD